MSATVAISADFFTSFAALPKHIQTKVTDFITKFKSNPQGPGINYEKIKDAADKKICSVRIDDTYRGIVVRQEGTGIYLLLWIDHHDEAYAWARSKKCAVNKETGNIQVFNVQKLESENIESEGNTGVFSHFSKSDLVKLGVPQEQVNYVKSIKSAEEFYESREALPADAYEYLEWLINDIPVHEVLEMAAENNSTHSTSDSMESALKNPGTRKSFLIVEGEKELEEMLSAPLERWRVFLHPTQRKISEADYSGPARILGGAGTGKTVVAMHRAKQLSTKMKASGKLLFTTFTANLADDILANLKSICTAQELRKIEVTNLDAWVAKYLRERGYGVTIVYGTDLDELWKDAIERTVDAPDFPIAFYEDEWAKVVASQDAFSKELYLKATRIGRGTRLDRRKRMMIWNVFNEFMILQKTRAVRDIDTALYECRKLVEARNSDPMYQSIVVDEGQDFSTNAYKLLRALAGTEHQNDIFIVGDTHQRIYKNHAILSQCGINIRGRSSYLRINYRTTEEIRRYAFAILNGVDFDDMDGEMVAGKPCQSLTHGEVPAFMNFGTLIEEANYISKEIRSLVDAGVEEKRICVVARTHKLLGNYMSTLMQNGYRIFEIKRNKVDDASYEGVRVATMHRVKGLEFDYVFVAGMNKGIMPLSSAINHTDQASEDESITAEKCLLYVALTRAKLKTYLTGYGKKSAQSHFLCDAGFRS